MSEPAEPKDLVDKLRGSLGWSKSRDHLCEAAANEIERLRDELRTLREQHVTSMNIEYDGSYLLICEGNHHRSEKCEYVRYARAL